MHALCVSLGTRFVDSVLAVTILAPVKRIIETVSQFAMATNEKRFGRQDDVDIFQWLKSVPVSVLIRVAETQLSILSVLG